MIYKNIITSRPTTNELVRLSKGEEVWLLKRYHGKDAVLHRNTEKRRLSLWDKKGYLVPKVINLELPNEEKPYLVIQWLDGEPLNEYLAFSKQAIEIKLKLLRKLIKLIHDRQECSQREQSYNFIHHDPNTGNIILIDDKFYYIDFEAIVPAAQCDVIDALAIELAKFLRWTIRDLGRQYLGVVIQMVIEFYTPLSPILNKIVNRVYQRKFQYIHRWKDKNKKLKNSEEITKYDIADELSFFLGNREK